MIACKQGLFALGISLLPIYSVLTLSLWITTVQALYLPNHVQLIQKLQDSLFYCSTISCMETQFIISYYVIQNQNL